MRGVITLATLLLLLLATSSAAAEPTASHLEQWARSLRPKKGAKREAIVVLGCATNPDGTPTPELERRLKVALKLARSRPQALIVVSGGPVRGPAEGPVMANWLSRRRVARSRIVVEDKARHTGENADLTVPILAAHRVAKVTLVTSYYHMARASFHMRWVLRKSGLGRIRLRRAAAPDSLRGPERFERRKQELGKIQRDRAFRQRDAQSRPFRLPDMRRARHRRP
jgi:hypothetical protein